MTLNPFIILQLSYLFAESWGPSVLTYLNSKIEAQHRGVFFSLFTFVGTVFGSLGPTLLGLLDDGVGDDLGTLLFGFVATSYVLCGLLFLWLHCTESSTRQGQARSKDDETATLLIRGGRGGQELVPPPLLPSPPTPPPTPCTDTEAKTGFSGFNKEAL